VIRRVYIRDCPKCDGRHWVEVEIDSDRTQTVWSQCPLRQVPMLVTYRVYVPKRRQTGNWL
jgi:hypothetical protein